MNILILKKFNNYFNRIIKKYDELVSYRDAADSYIDLTNINFNPDDGVRTELVLGKGQVDGFFDFEKTSAPDYLVCYKTDDNDTPDDSSDDVDTIESRWYIIETKRTRGGQYKLILKRDSIADNFDSLLNCPAFIKKATVPDDNPLIYNDEGISVNQIKQAEDLLKDKAGCSWIVGYIAKNALAQDVQAQIATEDFIDSTTIETVASEMGISADDLEAVLTTNSDNYSKFINGNIQVNTWINYPDATKTEFFLSTTSKNFLNSFTDASNEAKRLNDTNYCAFDQIENPNKPWYAVRYKLGYTATAADFPWGYAVSYAMSNWKNAMNSISGSIKSNWQNLTGNTFLTKRVYDKLLELESNKTLLKVRGRYYNIKHTSSTVKDTGNTYKVSPSASPFTSAVNDFITNYNAAVDAKGEIGSGGLIWMIDHIKLSNHGYIIIKYNEINVNFFIEEVTNFDQIPGITINMSSSRNPLNKQPYDMFAFPASPVQIDFGGGNEVDCTGKYAQEMAIAMMDKYTAAKVYDIQLLPYCPMPGIVKDGKIDVSGLSEQVDYDIVTRTNATIKELSPELTSTVSQGGPNLWIARFSWFAYFDNADMTDTGYELFNTEDVEIYSQNMTITTNQYGTGFAIEVTTNDSIKASILKAKVWYKYISDDPIIESVVLYPRDNSFSAAIDKTLELKDSMKVDNLCDNYRIVSPNYQGSFDFNVAKNGGQVRGFIADCSYKPYTPYIKIAPNFGGLYGTNYGDARGCICGGDFSLGFYEDKWQEFQLQNKNYQNIFNRDIQNLETMQGIQRDQAVASAVVGTVQGGMQGAMTGGVVGGGWGAAIGGVVGTGVSAVGGALDVNYLDRSLVEQRRYAEDKYHLQLGNIKALPYTLTKVGAFNINSKIWPILEYYTCTDVEKQALKNKIEYEGMTINIVDILEDYMNNSNYIQADLIRNSAVIEDSHQLDDIYVELTKGVYL